MALPSLSAAFGFPTPPALHLTAGAGVGMTSYAASHCPFYQTASSTLQLSPRPSNDGDFDHDVHSDCSSNTSYSTSYVYAPSSPFTPSAIVFPPSPISEDESALDLILPAALLADSTAAVASNPDVVDAAAKKRRSSSKRAATATARVSVKVARRHQCGMCPKSFASPSQLEEHFTYRHSDARTHVCSLCSKVFKTKSNLNQHLRTHVGNRFMCAACPEARSFTESGYRYHLLTKHSDDAVRRRFRCDLCPPGARSFAQNKLLQKHVASCHSDERKHECPHCPQTFKRADHLARHVSDGHSLVDNLFECSVVEDCGARFQSQRRLRQHESHHKASSPNLSKCDECGKVFSKRANLDKHFQQSHVKAEAVTDAFMPAAAAAVAEDIVSSLYAEGESSTTPSSLAGSSEGSSEGDELDEELQSLLLEGLLVGDEAVDHIAVEDLFA